MRLDIARAAATLHTSLDVLADSLTTTTTTNPTPHEYTRSSALFDRTERRLEERSARIDEGQLAIRDLKLIDGVMAKLAEMAGLPVTDFDTVGTPTSGIG
jgi:hypothetical protein